MKRIFLLLVVSLPIVAGGCFTPDKPSLTSNFAENKIPAIKAAADKNDRAAIPTLIVSLNDNDPAIRWASIRALEQMTGFTLGYRYFEDSDDRRPAIRRWQQWLAQQ